MVAPCETSGEGNMTNGMHELTPDQMDQVTGGAGKAASGTTKTTNEAPKETTTFEYGGLVVGYLQQSPNGA
jgi:hypothetical protein